MGLRFKGSIIQKWDVPQGNWLDRDDTTYKTVATLDPDGGNKEWHTLAKGIGWDSEQTISEVSMRFSESNDRRPIWWNIRFTDTSGNLITPCTDSEDRVSNSKGDSEVFTKQFDDTGAVTESIDKIELKIANTSTQSSTDFRTHELEFDAEYSDGVSYCNTC